MSTNQQLFDRAQQTIPGGVNSPVRAFRSVGGTPRFFKKASGPYVWDVEDKRYIDYIGSWGPAVLGHAHPEVIDAVQKAAVNGLSFGAPTECEVEMAELLCQMVPSMQQVRLVSSGTEATMSAIRVARGFTGRNTIVKFEGCYHGHADSLLVKAGSGLLTLGQPTSAGVPEDFAKHTAVLEYNHVEQLTELFRREGDSIAGVIVEPVVGNMNLIKPSRAFLETMRQLCTQYGAVLIFDEVMTGFRVGPQGVQGLYGIEPDLTTLGKIIGGGMPVGAFGGKKEIMGVVAPLGGVYQAGTLSGNPVSMAAGLATLRLLKKPGFYEQLEANTLQLVECFNSAAQSFNEPFCADSVGGMFGIYFSETVPTSFAEISQSNISRFASFFHAMLEQGVYLAPSAYEAGFVSVQHDQAVLQETKKAIVNAFNQIKL